MTGAGHAPEILAPAGTMEALTAAVRCGADAVYLGGKALNARRNAGNFSDDLLARAVSYCHTRGTKVYLALNTLVRDDEFPLAEALIAQSCALGVDALIVQDLGVAALARSIAPSMRLHASTQTSIHTPAGLHLLEEAGFSRAVLARELSAHEIAELAKETRLELEVFVHGALCMSVSGQCYFSAMLGSRSGNRGLCAQPCRLPFAAPGGTGHDLSLKDLSLLSHLRELTQAGVRSFKIEGRMKRPEYVAAAVTACRQAMEDAPDQELAGQLRAVFSRSGFTQGYYMATRGRDMFGVREKEDVAAAGPVLSSLAQLYARETPRVPVRFHLEAAVGQPLRLSAEARERHVAVQSVEPAQQAVNRPLTEEAVAAQLGKCGATPFWAESVSVQLDGQAAAPLSAVNALRRAALEELEHALGAPEAIPCRIGTRPPIVPYGKRRADRVARFSHAGQIPSALPGISAAIFPLDAPACVIDALVGQDVLPVLELPRGMFGKEPSVRAALEVWRERGAHYAFVNNLGALHLAADTGFTAWGGFGLNLFNTQALAFVQRLGMERALLSLELTLPQARAIGGPTPRGIFAYGRVPLMLTRNCPLANGTACKACDGAGALTDRKGVRFPVRCAGGCSEVLNSRPVYLADRLSPCDRFDFILLYFTTEPAQECGRVIRAFEEGATPEGEYTRGLSVRGVL